MMSKAPLRKGWCPGARRPMPVKDGLLVRLRISGGIVAAAIMRGSRKPGATMAMGFSIFPPAAIYKSGGSARAPCPR